MSGHYTLIQEEEMRELLDAQGFKEVFIEGTREIVYSKVVAKNTCLRVYTSVAYIDGESRDVGMDAIRVCLVYRKEDGTITGIGSDTKVYRIETWKQNLQKRLDKWLNLMGPTCKCGAPTKERDGKFGKFWGCCTYPICKGVTKE